VPGYGYNNAPNGVRKAWARLQGHRLAKRLNEECGDG